MSLRIDQALCDRAELLSRSHPLGTVAQLLGLRASTISRMRKRGWVAADWRSKVRPRPADFAIQSAHLTYAELLAHYACGPRALQRWFAETPARRPSWQGRRRVPA